MTNEELAVAIQGGDRGLLLTLWEQNRGFVYRSARRVYRALVSRGRHDVELDDLLQSSFIGVVDAATRFDPEAGGGFLGILDLCLKTAFASAAGYRSERQAKDPINGSLSLNTPLLNSDGEEAGEFIDTIADGADDYGDFVENDSIQGAASQILALLDEREAQILRLRYLDELSLDDAARVMGLSDKEARRLLNQARSHARRGEGRRIVETVIDWRTNFFRNGSSVRQESPVEAAVIRREVLRAEMSGGVTR